ncbi:MAG: ankyrin repeat domain-containing protein [Pseudomonadota bacterium]
MTDDHQSPISPVRALPAFSPVRALPAKANVRQQRTLAKSLRKSWANGEPDALDRIREHHPKLETSDNVRNAPVRLTDAQLVVAREYGFSSWPEFMRHLEEFGSYVGLTPQEKSQRLIEDPFLVTHGSPTAMGTDSKDLWQLIRATMRGDNRRTATMLDRDPTLVNQEFFYVTPLVFAAKEGLSKTVDLLLERGANPSFRAWWGEEPILKMVTDRGHDQVASKIRHALKQHDENVGAVIQAIRADNADQVRALLAAQPDRVNAVAPGGEQPLHVACELGNTGMVTLLLDSGADINGTDRRLGRRPIDIALWDDMFRPRDNESTVSCLVDRGAEITPEIAITLGDAARAKALIQSDSELVNFVSSFGMTPKAAAVQQKDMDLLRWLFEHGADGTLKEGPWEYALWAAVGRGYKDMAQLLCEHGANPDGYGMESSGSPAWIATYEGKEGGRDDDMVELMRRFGGHVSTLTKAEQIRELHAANPNNPQLPEEYVWSPDDPDIMSTLLSLKIPMPTAITLCQTYMWRNGDAFRTLLQNGLDPNLPNYLRMRPLHSLAVPRHNHTFENPLRDEEGHRDRAAIALEFGADIDAIDLYHDATPLGWAAKFGSLTMVDFFLSRGADPHLAGSVWAQPIEMARREGHEAIVRRLQSA